MSTGRTGKIKLKRTPQEEEEHQWRKARRAARKAKEAAGPTKFRASGRFRRHSSRSRSRSASPDPHTAEPRPQPLRDQDVAELFPPNQTLAELRAEIEEARFREKLASAMDDDDRLDYLEASLNAHIPPRYSSPGAGPSTSSTGNCAPPDPSQMNDEEYAEWVREGMWRRTHRAEVEEKERRERDRAARKDKQRRARKEVEKEEKEREARRAAARREKEKKKRAEAWSTYRGLWDLLTSSAASASANANATASLEPDEEMTPARPPFTFTTLPWPTYPPPIDPDGLTKDAVSAFLLAPDHSVEKTRKQRIREALLAYHPDRYIGRYMAVIDSSDQEQVKEAVVRVTTLLNALAEDEASR